MATSTRAAAEDDPATESAAAALPAFSMRETQVRKADSRNSVMFGVPTHSSVLLQLLRPKLHAYEEKDRRWLHLLQAVAVVPSGKVDTLQKLVQQALQLVPSPAWKQKLEKTMRALLAELDDTSATNDFSKRALVALQVKDRVAQFLREWLADPIEGFVLAKEHVVAGIRLDDLVATPAGAGYLRGYRRDDGFCIVLYPWGHGFIHLKCVERLEQAIVTQRKKRKFNEFLALEHQHLYEEVESLLENYPSEQPEGADSSAVKLVKLTPEGVDVEEYKKLVESLQEEEHFDPETLQHDLAFVRRVQALAAKTRDHQHQQHKNHEEDHKEQEQEQIEKSEKSEKSENPAEEVEEEEEEEIDERDDGHEKQEPLDSVEAMAED